MSAGLKNLVSVTSHRLASGLQQILTFRGQSSIFGRVSNEKSPFSRQSRASTVRLSVAPRPCASSGMNTCHRHYCHELPRSSPTPTHPVVPSPVSLGRLCVTSTPMISNPHSLGRAFSGVSEDAVYHEGLKKTVFSSELEVISESQTIPVFRIMNFDGDLAEGWQSPFSDDECVSLYKFMVKLSVWDDMLYNIQRQGRISFYIQNQGEEAVQTGVARALSTDDHLFCQYRELGVLMFRGFNLGDALDQCLSTNDDEGKGRQMPISYSKRNLNIHTIGTPLTTQVPHAAGSGYAFKIAGEKKCACAFFGEGAASEGDFHAALNFAATLKSQTMFICRNNGYAISTPVRDQYAGDGIAIRGVALGMKTIRVDGNDIFAVYEATKKCRGICVEESQPVCIEFMTYRMGHHSTSDDSSTYRPRGEKEMWSGTGIPPILRMNRYLTNNSLWNDQMEKDIRSEAKAYMLGLMKEIEAKQKFAVIPGIFDDVYSGNPWHLKEQEASLRQHLKTNAKYYDLRGYAVE